jgi:hypothetical protein
VIIFYIQRIISLSCLAIAGRRADRDPAGSMTFLRISFSYRLKMNSLKALFLRLKNSWSSATDLLE